MRERIPPHLGCPPHATAVPIVIRLACTIERQRHGGRLRPAQAEHNALRFRRLLETLR